MRETIARTGRRRAIGPALVLSLLAVPTAQAKEADWLTHAAPLSHQELSDSRGGFNIGGITMSFAVEIQSMVRTATEQIGLTTRLALSPDGGISDAQTTVSQSNPASVTGVNQVAGGIESVVSNATSSILHRVIGAQVETLSTNTASNAVLSQNTQINLSLHNFLSLADAFAGRALMGRIAGEIGRVGR